MKLTFLGISVTPVVSTIIFDDLRYVFEDFSLKASIVEAKERGSGVIVKFKIK